MVNSTPTSDWLYSILSNYEKIEKSTILSAPFLRSLLQLDTKTLLSRIYFRVKTPYIGNKYELYSRTCADESSMLEGVDFTVSYSLVADIFLFASSFLLYLQKV